MPKAFDPVRDAINNSPVNHSYALPPTPTLQPLSVAGPSVPRHVASASPAPPPPPPPHPPFRRSSSIAMLLNDPPAPPPLPHHHHASPAPPPSLSSFSYNDVQYQALSSPVPSVVHDASYPLYPYHHSPQTPVSPAGDSRSFSFPSQTDPPPSSRPPVQSKPSFPSLPPTRTSHSPSLSPTRSRPSSSSSPSYSMPPPPPRPAATALAYNPIRRTPPHGVLIPLTAEDIERFRRPDNALRRALRHGSSSVASSSHKRAAPPPPLCTDALPPVDAQWPLTPSRTPPGDDMTSADSSKKKRRLREGSADVDGPPMKRSRDQHLVASHYNARPEVGVAARRESPIIGLKHFNNWVKSVLFIKFAHPALPKPPPAPPNGRSRSRLSGRVLDLGCGKGGDLLKWSKAKVQDYVGLDIADVSVKQASDRYAGMKGKDRCNAFFAPFDCYSAPISTVVPKDFLSKPFDIVSMQFCMHYAFEEPTKVRTMLDNVTRYLRSGGIFVGTVPNGEQLLDQLNSIPADEGPPFSFGNDVYRIRFDNRASSIYGHRYFFYLQDAVEDVPEYIIHWDHFQMLAHEYGLELLYRKEFHQVFDEERENPEFQTLLQRMNVADSNGVSSMTEEQWEAANIYVAFAFVKR